MSTLLNMIDDLQTTAEDESMHILDRIDAYLEIAVLGHRDPHIWMPAVRKAQKLIKDELTEQS